MESSLLYVYFMYTYFMYRVLELAADSVGIPSALYSMDSD